MELSDPLPDLDNGSWHTWGLRWNPTGLTFYYDDTAIWSRPDLAAHTDEHDGDAGRLRPCVGAGLSAAHT